jgi:MFS superfamily sulfate permease-like transporter
VYSWQIKISYNITETIILFLCELTESNSAFYLYSMDKNLFKYTKNDLISGLVVFLVALPLCLGIALASGAPLFAGVIAGVVGGIVIGSISNSQLGVSGPAAGLTTIVLVAITSMGDYQVFLMSVVLAGIMQIIFSVIGAGKIAYFIPSSVIKGMLAAIGIIIILKQFVHAFGIDKDYEGDFSFFQPDGENTFSEILQVFNFMSGGALLISVVCMAILILWEQKFIKKNKILAQIPASLICVVVGTLMNVFYPENLKLAQEHLVSLPVSNSASDFLNIFTFPKWEALTQTAVWGTALVLALVASIETLLCVEATDKLDPEKRITPTNRELLAQGVGNIASGLIGGIPVTQVVVRSTANLNSGAKTKMSAIYHGVFLLFCVVFLPTLLNKIPYSALAAVLIMVGYKLAKPSLFKEMFREGWYQFIPFIVTVLAINLTDLLKGVGIGLAVGLAFVIYYNFKSTISHFQEGKSTFIKFKSDIFFYNRANLVDMLSHIKTGENVILDATDAHFVDYDIYQTIEEFDRTANAKGINFETKNLTKNKIVFKTRKK